ncbi:MAG: hypothetical protein HS116_05300 [Planctomycetes bacterium]|nr:hypothetical protein [Planctomycetota bacterium]
MAEDKPKPKPSVATGKPKATAKAVAKPAASAPARKPTAAPPAKPAPNKPDEEDVARKPKPAGSKAATPKPQAKPVDARTAAPPKPKAAAEPPEESSDVEGSDGAELTDAEKLAKAQAFAEARLRQEAEARKVENKRLISRTWQRRILWVVVLIFGMGIFKLVSLYTFQEPPRARTRTEQTAINKLGKQSLADMLPLKAPLLKPDPCPWPAHVQPLPEPRIAAPRVAIVSGWPSREADSEPAEARQAAAAFTALLRRDLALVDTLSLFDPDLANSATGSLKQQLETLKPYLMGLEAVVQIAAEQKDGKLTIRMEYCTPTGTPVRGPEAVLEKGTWGEIARPFVQRVLAALNANPSIEAQKRIEALKITDRDLTATGLELLNTEPGKMSGGYASMPLVTAELLRGLKDQPLNIYVRAVLFQDPHNVETLWRQETALPPGEANEFGLKMLDEALKRSPHFGPANMSRARRLQATGAHGPALEAAARAAALMPGHPGAHTLLAELYLANRAPLPAKQHADRALEIDPLHAGAWALRCAIATASDDLPAALEAADAFLAKLPAAPEAHAWRFRTLLNLNKPADAKAALDAAQDAWPADQRALLEAEWLGWNGRFEEALAALAPLEAGDKTPGAVRRMRERLLELKDLPGLAQKVLEAAQAAEYMTLLARAGRLHNLGQREKLAETIAKLEQLAPEDPRSLRWRIQLMAHEEARFESLPYVEKLDAVLQGMPKAEGSAVVPPNREDAYHAIEALLAHARFDDARKRLSAWPPQEPGNPRQQIEAHILLTEGLFYATQLNDYEQAAKSFVACLNRDRRRENQLVILEQMEAYLRILGQAGKVDESATIQKRFSSVLDDALAARLKTAIEEVQAAAKKK